MPGLEPPSPEIVEALRRMSGEYGSAATLAELETILEYRDYPSFPNPQESLDPIPVAPTPEIDDVSFKQPYVVQEEDTLWDIAAGLGESYGIPTDDVIRLIDSRNSNTSSAYQQFDPDRSDSNLTTQADWFDERRDPDLIHPGDQITLAILAEIVRPEGNPTP